MKTIKLSLIICLLVLFCIKAHAQKNSSESDNCVREGKFIIDAYYGYPYVMGDLMKSANSSSINVTNEKVTNYNHIGGKIEYMINDMIGMGIDYTYAKVAYSYSGSYYAMVNGQTVLKNRRFTQSLTKQRALIRINIHFATTRELDPYATGGVGYKQNVFKSDDPNDIYYDEFFYNTFPLVFRLGTGLRWFFSKRVGLNIEAGIGGPVIQGGLSAKF